MVVIFAFITVLALIPLACKLADKAGFVDVPNGRKQHETPIPPIGGAVIFIVFLSFMVALGHLPWGVMTALALIVTVGIIDDAWDVNAKLKFALHFLAAFIMVIGGGAQINTLGNILGFGEMQLGLFAIPFSVACIVYIQNAVNMMDGMDGLAGGNSFLILGWMLLAVYIGGGNFSLAPDLPILMACLLGFLVFNMRSPILKRAKIFLGDAGSMALGLMIAWYAITLSQGTNAVIHPISVAWVIALPIVDSFGLLATRLKEGRHPFAADRRHFHHHFADAGFSPSATTRLILLYSAILGGIGFIGLTLGLPEYVLGWGWVALWMGHTALTMKSEKFTKRLTRLCSKTQH